MKLNTILYIISSSENCKKIKNELIGKYDEVHCDLNTKKNDTSLKSIYNQAKKSGEIEKGDFVIAIDDINDCKFINDITHECSLHFLSISDFVNWLDEKFT